MSFHMPGAQYEAIRGIIPRDESQGVMLDVSMQGYLWQYVTGNYLYPWKFTVKFIVYRNKRST